MTAQFGAHETMELHEILNTSIDGINNFELYRDHVQDPQLRSILDKQIQFMTQEFNTLVQTVQQQGLGQATPYRGPKNVAPKYGLRQPGAVSPNASPTDMDDRDVASGMLSCHKSGAVKRMAAALEFANPQLRGTIQQTALNCAEQAFEVWNFMNQKGMYQVPTMMDMTTNTMMQTFTPAGAPGQGLRIAQMPQ